MLYESYYGISDFGCELEHHGVKGMRWGVRRYQNYDGTYTQRGVQRFKEKDADYEKSVQKYKQTKKKYKEGNATKQDVKYAKGKTVRTKNALELSYKKLKNDKLADQGKKLYKEGKRIRSNNKLHRNIAIVSAGAVYATHLLALHGNLPVNKTKNIVWGALGASAAINAVNAGIYAKNKYQNKRISAYYAH